jgi:sulfate/thiosulfate transport system permease protein
MPTELAGGGPATERPAGPPRLDAPTAPPRPARLLLRTVALGYLAMVLVLPVGAVAWRAFGDGAAAVVQAVTTPDALHAFWLTVLIAAIAVPLNTLFGVACAVVLVRHHFRGKRLLDAVIDLPFAISPVVIGLALVLVYGQAGWLGGWLAERGVPVIFSLPGMVVATIFVSLPYVVREVVPVLREVGTEQEEAAWTLGASALRSFLSVTLPSIRWGVAYGVVLTTARAIGEFGAVTLVSGRLAGQTETMTLYVENRYEAFDLVGAYAAALVLAALALLILLVMTRLNQKGSS